MQQLADGERSRILQKRLKGSSQCIFETYLEQKSGFRILWTEEGDSIVVWFVAKHKEVSRLMRLIDDSKNRTARQRMSHELISDFRNENLVRQSTQKDGVLLDVFGNVPLKLYEATFHSINEITKDSWTPKLHLTEEERDIVETEGTVLVQGRSGTGKVSGIDITKVSIARLLLAKKVFYCCRQFASVIALNSIGRSMGVIQPFLSSLLLDQRGSVGMCRRLRAPMSVALF